MEHVAKIVGTFTLMFCAGLILYCSWVSVGLLVKGAWRRFRLWRKHRAERLYIQARDGKCPHGFPVHNVLRDCKTCREADAAELADDAPPVDNAKRRQELAQRLGFDLAGHAEKFARGLLLQEKKLIDRRWYWGNIPENVLKLGPEAVKAYKIAFMGCIEKPPPSNINLDFDGQPVTAAHFGRNNRPAILVNIEDRLDAATRKVFIREMERMARELGRHVIVAGPGVKVDVDPGHAGYNAYVLKSGMVRIENVPILGICTEPSRRVTADTLWWLLDRARRTNYTPPITIGQGLNHERVGYLELTNYKHKQYGPTLFADLVVNEETFHRILELKYPYYTVAIGDVTGPEPFLAELALLEMGPVYFKDWPSLKIYKHGRRG